MNIELIENRGGYDVFIDSINLGVFDTVDKGIYSYFPKRNDQITGVHLIEIGHKLNELNGVCVHGISEKLMCSQCIEDAEFDDIYGANNDN